jgi:5-(carboxyamino)imidazole ribonucleotide synthase
MASPTATVGMVGAGQLARMTHAAAIGLGVRLRVLAAAADDAAARVNPSTVVDDWGSLEALRAFAAGCDVVTFDHELLDPAHLAALVEEGVALAPPPAAKRFAQDKLHQRRGLAAAGLAVPAFAEVGERGHVAAFAEAHGWPAVLKATRGGYDGRGVWLVGADDVAAVWGEAARAGQLVVEAHVPVATELAVLVARTAAGDTAVYPVVETVQRDGICVETLAPARVEADVARRAGELGRRVADAVGAVGMCAVELFATPGGELVVNELALRPHNSGHWSIEGAVTSQFANHLRAVLGWPLGATEPTGAAVATVNLLGPADGSDPAQGLPRALEVADAHVHLYGKAARPGRKLGHVTVVGRDHDAALTRARRAAATLHGQRVPA